MSDQERIAELEALIRSQGEGIVERERKYALLVGENGHLAEFKWRSEQRIAELEAEILRWKKMYSNALQTRAEQIRLCHEARWIARRERRKYNVASITLHNYLCTKHSKPDTGRGSTNGVGIRLFLRIGARSGNDD